MLNKVFGELTVIEETDKRKDGRVVYVCKCSCGNFIEASSHDLRIDRKWHCGCKLVSSRGELKIQNLLQSNNIVFEREKHFYGLGRLRFDFYVNNSYIIKFDGIQHFYKDTGYGKNLEEIQRRDKIKTDQCINNNIPLIRIPYTDQDIFTYNDLFPETSRYLVKGGNNE